MTINWHRTTSKDVTDIIRHHNAVLCGNYSSVWCKGDVFYLEVKTFCRACIGLLIAKYMSAGGFTYDVYTKLYNSLVWPVIEYGGAVWGLKSFSCINPVHNRAMRLY
mgnify:CR=1 FL=1